MIGKHAATELCVKCGKEATGWAGHVTGYEKMALGNLVPVKIHAGWCHIKCHDTSKSDENGCYGDYDPKMGFINDVFEYMEKGIK